MNLYKLSFQSATCSTFPTNKYKIIKSFCFILYALQWSKAWSPVYVMGACFRINMNWVPGIQSLAKPNPVSSIHAYKNIEVIQNVK